MAKIIEVCRLEGCFPNMILYNTLVRDADGPASRTSVGLINLSDYFSDIEMDHIPTPHNLGEIDYRMLGKVLSCQRYHPFSESPKDTWRGSFLGKGIANQIELLVLRDLALRLGGDKVMVPSDVSSSWRRNQLSYRGVKLSKGYPLRQHIQSLERN